MTTTTDKAFTTKEDAVAQLAIVLDQFLTFGQQFGKTPGGSASKFLERRLDDFNGDRPKMLQWEAKDIVERGRSELRLDDGGLKAYITIRKNELGCVLIERIKIDGDCACYYPEFCTRINDFLKVMGYQSH